ncbi:MAG: GNAT family N-acetyltransferase [Pyrinomonadaceae bacterium]
MSELRIEKPIVADVPLILEFVRDLAEYEKLADSVAATEDRLRETLFGPNPSAHALLAYDKDDPVGFAIYFFNYSTFVGRPGLYLEDLFVRPEARGKGFGRALLQHLARIAVERNCGRMEWAVLNWNEPALGFYQSLGANPMADWIVFRLSGKALEDLAR